MLRKLFARPACLGTILAVVLVSSLMTSCGGGDGYAAKDMALVEFLLVNRALEPVAATGTDNLPRNAQILLVFSELVNPDSIDSQSIQIRFGPAFQSVPKGSFSVTGNTVRFDPTVTVDGQPNPFGFEPVTQYSVDIPNFEEQTDVVENADFDPNLTTFFTTFTSSDGFLREYTPPEITGVGFIPDVDPLTGNIPGAGLMYFDFSEPMDPGSFIQGGFNGPTPETTIDVRFTTAAVNAGAGLTTLDANSNPIGIPISGTYNFDASATRFFFRPTFSFGSGNFVFFAQVFQGLLDLSGNQLVNPGTFGVYICDGNGRVDGKLLVEDFVDTLDQDIVSTDADWNLTEEGHARGQAITSRNAYLFGYQEADDFGANPDSGRGQYAPIVDPLIGKSLNQLVSGINPPTDQGRRVMWAISDVEMGSGGSITDVGWGPDSNALFAAQYDSVKLRMGHQKDDSLALGTSFEGNYEGNPAVVYDGEYPVIQAQNIGNTTGHPQTTHVTGYGTNPGCNPTNGVGVQFDWNAPLYGATGFYAWPELSSFFEWDEGNGAVDGDSVFLFDASVDEGDNFQQIRAWFGSTFPCSGVLLPGIPNRRLYATYEEESANPVTNLGAGILNPEPTVMDLCFTVTKRVSTAQTLFYYEAGNPIQAAHGNTYGDTSDYFPAEITPQTQPNGASVIIEYQGADLVEDDRRTINVAGLFTDWTRNIDDCDGMQKLRFRILLISNLVSGQIASVDTVRIPIIEP